MMITGTDSPLVGQGWRWPAGVDAAGNVALAGGDAEIEQAMYLVLATTPGERPMRPEFGCDLAHFVFAAIEPSMLGLLAREVRAALTRWEPRVEIADVITAPHPDREGTVLIDIRYQVSGTYNRRSLVVPFYTIPDHEDALK